MTRILLALLLLLAAACATSQRAYAPVDNVRYQALGHNPFWMLAIGDDRIVLRLGHDGGEDAGENDDIVFPRTLPRTVEGVRTWQSGEGTQVITIEARPDWCDNARGTLYSNYVRVRLSGRELEGCGGPIIQSERR